MPEGGRSRKRWWSLPKGGPRRPHGETQNCGQHVRAPDARVVVGEPSEFSRIAARDDGNRGFKVPIAVPR
jgi:hypothetical protein